MLQLLDDRGVAHKAHGDGWLYHWLLFMLIKGHNTSEQRFELDRRIDTMFNTTLRAEDRRGPHYRRAIVMRPPTENYPDFNPLAEPGDVEGDLARLTEVGWELTKALPKGEAADLLDSNVRQWAQAQGRGEAPVQVAARNLLAVLDGAVELAAAGAGALPGGTSTARPSVAVILVNLNSRDELAESLISLAAQTYPKDLLDVIVVDNASTDGSLELLAERFPWARVLPQDTNTGFSPAVDPVPVHQHRHHRVTRRPERPGERLGERLAALGGRDRAQEVPADLGRVGVAVADPVGAHDDHEVGAGVPAHLLGVRLQHGARLRCGQPLPDRGRGGHRVRHPQHLVLGGGRVGRAGVRIPGDGGADHHHQDHHRLEGGEQLGGQAPAVRAPPTCARSRLPTRRLPS